MFKSGKKFVYKFCLPKIEKVYLVIKAHLCRYDPDPVKMGPDPEHWCINNTLVS